MRRFLDVSIRTKLYALVTCSTLGLLAVLGLSAWLLSEFRINGPVYDRIITAKDIVADILPPPEYVIEPFLVLHQMDQATEPKVVEELTDRFRRLEAEYRQRHEYWVKQLPTGALRSALVDASYRPAEEFFTVAKNDYLPAKARGEHDAAREVLLGALRSRYEAHRQAIDLTVELANRQAAAEEAATAQRMARWISITVFIGVATALAVAVLGALLARNIVRSTRVLIARVEEMAHGASDLTARVDVQSHDEMGRLAAGINHLIGKIQAIVLRVREEGSHLLGTACQIAATSRQQDTTVHDLGGSMAEIAAAVQEINAASRNLAATMGEVNERSNEAATLASSGRSRLSEMQDAMEQLVAETSSFSNKLALIREKADAINVVVSTITKVADQTNLLSINAAIEAEKAGEAGLGFLVVAREIRRLADQTAVSTLDIETMVRHMHGAVSSGVMQMDHFSANVRAGMERVSEISTQTGLIIAEVHELSKRFQEVNEGMRQQSLGVHQINDAMLGVSTTTRDTAASLDEFHRVTADLRQSAESLTLEVGKFQV
ncbi:MAG: methyl-accepting chemotaxis protein [Isosphaeraceae bacterium]|nr:methyl-accepting chemotaxis protein [Isosphaeraceae bacterium]